MATSAKTEVESLLLEELLGKVSPNDQQLLKTYALPTVRASRRCDIGNTIGGYASLWSVMNVVNTSLYEKKDPNAKEKSEAIARFVAQVEELVIEDLVKGCGCRDNPLLESQTSYLQE